MMKKEATALDLSLLELDEYTVPNEPEPLRLRVGNCEYPWWQSCAKRAVDVVSSLLVMTVGAPLFIFLAVAVKLSSPGPIFFRQVRIGKDGQPFVFYKFRSMRHNNDDAAHRDFAREFINGDSVESRDRTVFKMVRDPRITAIGRFLRRSSLDELPQFYNVLRGEMSLVGPRPPFSYELDHYQDWHRDRLMVKPGLTGLWQVSGRSDISSEQRFALDTFYIEHWSMGLDLEIILKTVPAMLSSRGAY